MNGLAITTMVASMVAVLVAVSGMLASIFKRGQVEGRTTEILSQLTAIQTDHEARIRTLEHTRNELIREMT